mgnify:FL=1
MSTKFILHGGYAGRSNSKNDEFFKEILKNVPRNAKILFVYFAKKKNEYQEMQKEDATQFEKNKGEHDISLVVASPESFTRQIEWSDVVYLHGGNTFRLLVELKKHQNLKNLIDGKIVAGESAGAYALSACFYSKIEGGIFKGLGFVPVKTICHYIGENKEKLKKCSVELETLLLADYQYRVFQ